MPTPGLGWKGPNSGLPQPFAAVRRLFPHSILQNGRGTQSNGTFTRSFQAGARAGEAGTRSREGRNRPGETRTRSWGAIPRPRETADTAFFHEFRRLEDREAQFAESDRTGCVEQVIGEPV